MEKLVHCIECKSSMVNITNATTRHDLKKYICTYDNQFLSSSDVNGIKICFLCSNCNNRFEMRISNEKACCKYKMMSSKINIKYSKHYASII